MSDKVQRWRMGTDHYWGDTNMFGSDTGDWVEYADYAALLDKYNKLLKNIPVKEEYQCY
jgi:hypothetical protein